MEGWPESVRRVGEFLLASRAEARIEEFASGTPTATDAAEAAGCDLAQIVKSLVVVADGRPALVMVPGDRRADLEKVAGELGAKAVWAARPPEVRGATGFDAGGVAPFPLPRIDHVLADRSLLGHDRVWVGAGSDRHMAEIRPAELVRLSRARVVDAVETPS